MSDQNNASNPIQPDMDNFINELIKVANIGELPEEFKQEYKENLNVEIHKRMGMAALAALDEKGMDEYIKLMESMEDSGQQPDADKVADFFQKNIPDYENKMQVALKEFGQEFIRSSQKLQQDIQDKS